MNMVSSADRSREDSPATPLLAIVSSPAAYRNEIGRCTVGAGESDLVSRLMFMQRMHKTYAGTSTVCTGVASRIPGTVVHEVTRRDRPARAVAGDVRRNDAVENDAFGNNAVENSALENNASGNASGDIVRIGHPAGVIETEARVERTRRRLRGSSGDARTHRPPHPGGLRLRARRRMLLSAPGTIGPMRLKNRVIMAPMGTNYGTTDGFATDRDKRYYAERAKGGVALIVTEAMNISAGARNHNNSLCAFHDAFIPG